MKKSFDRLVPSASRLKPINVIPSANWQSAKDCPPMPDPHDLCFIIVSNWIPGGFLWCDITTMPGVRHLIFATDEQIEVLRSAHTLWVDATFKLVKGPFYQLFFCARVYLWEQW